MAKAAGYNTVRFIAGVAYPEQLELCDELGLMVYEENLSSWWFAYLPESPEGEHRCQASLDGMIRRDRNHPSVVIWGLLNETRDGTVFKWAAGVLPKLRALDPTRLVLLSSGRWDSHPEIGSVCNPGSDVWEYQWGNDNPKALPGEAMRDANPNVASGFSAESGDLHSYMLIPHTFEQIQWLRGRGQRYKPVYLSEYGVGSLFDAIGACGEFENRGVNTELYDFNLCLGMRKKLLADWREWGFDGVYPFARDMLIDSARHNNRLREIGFDMVRSNSRFCGWNITGMLDHGLTGEGFWTFWRNWKPGSAETLDAGWAPLRWCLFAERQNIFRGDEFNLEAVLANDSVLKPGKYTAILRIAGNGRVGWEKKIEFTIPDADEQGDTPLAISVFKGMVSAELPAGEYTFAAELAHGGTPAAGRLRLWVSEHADIQQNGCRIFAWGWPEKPSWVEDFVELSENGSPAVIVVGGDSAIGCDQAGWEKLYRRVVAGDIAIFVSTKALEYDDVKIPAGCTWRRWCETLADKSVPAVRFEIDPVCPPGEEEIFRWEFQAAMHFEATGLQEGRYRIVCDFCECLFREPKERLFSMTINGKTVLEDFDMVAEAGGMARAVTREFEVQISDGRLEIASPCNNGSVSRIRIYDETGTLIIEDSAYRYGTRELRRFPGGEKIGGAIYTVGDSIYHKECVAKVHSVFEGISKGGILDMEFCGPMLSHRILEGAVKPEEMLAAAFCVGWFRPGGYASGSMLARYKIGRGSCFMNTFDLSPDNPAAARLTANMIHYACELVTGSSDE
jgi:hypothetical protein